MRGPNRWSTGLLQVAVGGGFKGLIRPFGSVCEATDAKTQFVGLGVAALAAAGWRLWSPLGCATGSRHGWWTVKGPGEEPGLRRANLREGRAPSRVGCGPRVVAFVLDPPYVRRLTEPPRPGSVKSDRSCCGGVPF